MPKSFSYKSKHERLGAYDAFTKNHGMDKLFLDNFIKLEPDKFEELEPFLSQIKPNQKYMGIVFAKIFNLILKINHMNSGGQIISYRMLDANFNPINKTVYALTGLGDHTKDLNEENKSGEMYMKRFLRAHNCSIYLAYGNVLNQETQEFWIKNMVSLPSYEKYFSSKNGSFVSEANLYAKDFIIFLEKITLESGLKKLPCPLAVSSLSSHIIPSINPVNKALVTPVRHKV